MEIRVIVGPSGSGKRTRMAILQDLFGFMTVTGVRPKHLTRAVQHVVGLEGDGARLIVEIPTIHFSAQPFSVQSESFVTECMRAFLDLKESFRDADLAVIFQYCAQQDLAKRLVLGFHPLMHTVGNLQGAVFAECTTQVQLFKRLCKEYDVGVFADRGLIFSDRTGKAADQLKDEISQRRYLKHPDDPDVDTEGVAEGVGLETQRRRTVKETLAAISAVLKEAQEERHKEKLKDSRSGEAQAGRDVPPLQFISRGWNAMQATILDIAKARDLVRSRHAPRVNCLLVGDSGTGKEAIAAFLHYCRHDRGKLVTVDCTAIPNELLESELFGSRKGAYTGAYFNRPGLLQGAKDGTVFLDEIGLMPLSLQAKLLRFIETRSCKSVGSDDTVEVLNCRVIAATSRNLDEAVRRGEFLLDLYNRLRAVTITVPPLRERREDIPYLLAALAPNVAFKPGAEALLFDYHWEGNVRELRSVTERYESAHADSERAGVDGPITVGVSTLLEDWPRSVARDYLEGAMKWRWPMREQTRQARIRIYHEVKRELERTHPSTEDDGAASSDTAATPALEHAADRRAFEAATSRGTDPHATGLSAEGFRQLYRQAIRAGLFTYDDNKAFWRKLAHDVLEEQGGNKKAAAEAIGVKRPTFYGLLEEDDDETQADARGQIAPK